MLSGLGGDFRNECYPPVRVGTVHAVDPLENVQIAQAAPVITMWSRQRRTFELLPKLVKLPAH